MVKTKWFQRGILLLTVLSISGCKSNDTDMISQSLGGVGIQTNFKPEFWGSGEIYKPLEITADAPEYQLDADLSNIENISRFTNLTQKQREMIVQNGFVVVPTDSEQLFYIYEENTDQKVPSFVTTDSVLQLYHLFYDYSLRTLETDYFYEDLMVLNDQMIGQLTTDYKQIKNDEVKDNIFKMLGYFGVANLSMGKALPDEFPAKLADIVKQECELIKAAEGSEVSPLFGNPIDYSLFQVRGHYTRSEELGNYFRAMSWYNAVPIPFYDQNGDVDEQSAMRAIVATIALCRLPEEQGIKLWENIYSTTSFFVGESKDFSPYEVAGVIEKVYTDTPDMNRLPDKMDAFYLEIEQMNTASTVLDTAEDDSAAIKQMRFMGQRYIPDTEILQKLTKENERPFPCGADVFAVFGSPRAKEILDECYKPAEQWDKYQENFDILSEKFQKQTVAEQTGNLYNGWLYCLKSLTSRVEEGYPFFMNHKAWEDKALSTALGSWSEIRHDSILYTTQSLAELGEEEEPEMIGYVEPNPEFFNRLLWLSTITRDSLAARGLLNEGMEDNLTRFIEMLDFLKACAQKELIGEDLTVEEYDLLSTYGGTLEALSSSAADASNWYEVESETDKNMAVIADIHTDNTSGTCLEVGVGTAAEIYVAIPQNGKIYLTRGAVFDYYEFRSEERLTDEAWEQKVKKDPPQRPPFTHSYMVETNGGDNMKSEEPE